MTLSDLFYRRPRPWRRSHDTPGVVLDSHGKEVCCVDTMGNMTDEEANEMAQAIVELGNGAT